MKTKKRRRSVLFGRNDGRRTRRRTRQVEAISRIAAAADPFPGIAAEGA